MPACCDAGLHHASLGFSFNTCLVVIVCAFLLCICGSASRAIGNTSARSRPSVVIAPGAIINRRSLKAFGRWCIHKQFLSLFACRTPERDRPSRWPSGSGASSPSADQCRRVHRCAAGVATLSPLYRAGQFGWRRTPGWWPLLVAVGVFLCWWRTPLHTTAVERLLGGQTTTTLV